MANSRSMSATRVAIFPAPGPAKNAGVSVPGVFKDRQLFACRHDAPLTPTTLFRACPCERDPAKVTIYAPGVIQVPAVLVPVLRSVSLKGIQAGLRAPLGPSP
jgi:hypothetical protein